MVPSPDARMPEINLFIVDLYEAHQDCMRKLAGAKAVIDTFKLNVEKREGEKLSLTRQYLVKTQPVE